MKFIKSKIKLIAKGLSYQDLILDSIYRAAKNNDIPYDFVNITYGIKYALDTQRLPGKIDYVIKNLSNKETCDLIYTLYENKVLLIGDIPRELIKMYS